jgi:hypothetical protein
LSAVVCPAVVDEPIVMRDIAQHRWIEDSQVES